MTLPPVVERELRAGARRPGLFWLRGSLALAAGFQVCELLDRYGIAPPSSIAAAAAGTAMPVITGAALLHDMAWLAFAATLLMGLLSADSINREQREGTLGLLLLTDLSPAQIVRSKMLSCGLASFTALLGILPAFALAVLAGGVSGVEAVLTGLGLLNALFVSLAFGLWMSAAFNKRHFAMLATLCGIGVLAFGAELFGGSIFGTEAAPLLRFFGLGGWMTVAHLPITLAGAVWLTGWPPALRVAILVLPAFLLWFAATNALGWLFLRQAATTLTNNWQDKPLKHVREPEPSDEWSPPAPVTPTAGTPPAAPARASWLTDPRPWDGDPIRWRVERMGAAEGLIWLGIVFNFLAQFGALGPMFNASSTPVASWGLLSVAGAVVISCASGLLAWAGGRFFQQSRRQQDIELLLTTPVGGLTILSGQWRVLRRVLAWPLGLVLALALTAGIALVYDWANGYREEIWLLLHPFLIAVNVAVETVALCWVGMKFGLRARNAPAAVALTVAVVQLLPLTVVMTLIWTSAWLSHHSLFATGSRGAMPPVILALLLFLAKNVAFIAWARFRLRRDLRLSIRPSGLDASARRLTLQPA